MNYILLFLEGIITFISPCILPMIPIYVSYFAGGDIDNKNYKNRALISSIAFVAGFTFVFTLLGVAAGTVGVIFNKYMREINIVSGTIMVIFGLNYLGIINIGLLNKSFKMDNPTGNKKSSIMSAILFGMIFGIGWTPCVGPFLGSALMIASNSTNVFMGASMLLTYSLGLGIPFVLSALLIDSLKTTFDFIKRNYKTINRISGVFLIIIGIMMMTGYLNLLLSILTF
ncbi:cytochrome C biogenesis transmembrane region family protein [Clostridium argentinense CDC 2741]|uniref:Cytochrome C biogenesis transmembrane region family protein n=1 Tax=Clostridium argentinense CDC 2741 TaxID=1418104 RepID=A0A0C1UGY1_9CLOT|nr:cytochrome c biogenesis protein CcdA [Clostridium argentinense]ARC86475.1 cytochrome C biogenesis protein CcdA [Clostridium argentinense]KIE46670.1 cytochrome C biogenesis transmembrane region family protein [Clostridium argentinense CDC 2741]NFF37936.1 cytochrome C biogenesis protein CcdA [Clostridium argentinense]NFP49832.1 cytochrome C biogenesis protein CcdA [Clostridium argentinense]NFP71328.1 cytochrome C biogenesis protein CcdA [Clostridium argentinense]